MKRWQDIHKESFRNITKLINFLELDNENKKEILNLPLFPLLLPLRLAKKIKKNCLKDPILRQFIPLNGEQISNDLFTKDPVGDVDATKGCRYLQKYQGRALLYVTSACAMNCRYCFRQHYSSTAYSPLFEKELSLIRENEEIHEVILSGGDPLSLTNNQLSFLFKELDEIDHLKIIRIHSRSLIGLPERLDPQLLMIFKESKKQIIFVLHTNHKNEFDQDILDALLKIKNLGIPLLTQSVLLKGVNNSYQALFDLFFFLISHGIIPYYLHQLDRVQGATAFEVDVSEGHRLISSLRKSLPGYAIPSYVQEIASEPHKTPL